MLMPSSNRHPKRWTLAYLGIALWFLAAIAAQWQCGDGFTSLIAVGDRFYERALPEFKEAQPRVFENSYGYDGQFYAQIALDPSIQHPQFERAIDNLSYRARRILMPAAAWALGGGDPRRIVDLYPLLNPLCWLACAALLLKWLPPAGPQNFIRWAGFLLGWGWTTSAMRALPDGPAVTLTVLAAYFLSADRQVKGTLALAASALTKDVSLLAGLGLWRREKSLRTSVLRFSALGALCAAPLLAWWLCLQATVPPRPDSFAGVRNFSLPFLGLAGLYGDLFEQFRQRPSQETALHLLGFVGIGLHATFLLLRPQWGQLWWRLGIGFAALALVLGPAVWEGAPGAAPRVLLALHLAFNLLLPRGRRWIPLLILGNLSMLSFPALTTPPDLSPQAQRCIESSRFLSLEGNLAQSGISLSFGSGWHPMESSGGQSRVWSESQALVHLENPSDRPIQALITLELLTHYPRTTTVAWNGSPMGDLAHDASAKDSFTFGPVTLLPGSNLLEISGTPVALAPSNGDPRKLGVALFQVVATPPQ